MPHIPNLDMYAMFFGSEAPRENIILNGLLLCISTVDTKALGLLDIFIISSPCSILSEYQYTIRIFLVYLSMILYTCAQYLLHYSILFELWAVSSVTAEQSVLFYSVYQLLME